MAVGREGVWRGRPQAALGFSSQGSQWLLDHPGLSVPAKQARIGLDQAAHNGGPWPRGLGVPNAVGMAPSRRRARRCPVWRPGCRAGGQAPSRQVPRPAGRWEPRACSPRLAHSLSPRPPLPYLILPGPGLGHGPHRCPLRPEVDPALPGRSERLQRCLPGLTAELSAGPCGAAVCGRGGSSRGKEGRLFMLHPV